MAVGHHLNVGVLVIARVRLDLSNISSRIAKSKHINEVFMVAQRLELGQMVFQRLR